LTRVMPDTVCAKALPVSDPVKPLHGVLPQSLGALQLTLHTSNTLIVPLGERLRGGKLPMDSQSSDTNCFLILTHSAF
jgi:hypothetical protein